MRKHPFRLIGLGVLLVLASVVVPLAHTQSAQADTGNLSTSALQAAGAPPCPSGWTCVPMPCPTANHCGIVEAGPTSNLGPGQWVYLNFYGFTPNEALYLYYCQDPGSFNPAPLCSYQSTNTQPNPMAILKAGSDGTSQLSFQSVEADSSGGSSSALPGRDPGNVADTGTFFCDPGTGSNHCSIDVIAPLLGNHGSLAPNATTTLAVPLTFASATGACAQATQVDAEGEFGADLILGAIDPLTCGNSGSSATIPFETSIDGLAGLQAMANGTVGMAFTDDPQAASQQAIISSKNYLAIPIAISANTVAFRSQVENNQEVLPQPDLSLTANMVAGLISSAYFQVQQADVIPCTVGSCPAISFLNNEPGDNPARNYGAFLRSDTAGTTDQLFNWICNAKPMSLTFTTLNSWTGTEPTSAEDVLKGTLYAQGNSPSGCLQTDQFPPYFTTDPNWITVANPNTQSLKLSQFVMPPGSSSTPVAGFADMSWAEASYYGMSLAALQNAAGQFVAPTSASVIAGLANGAWNAQGVWTPNYATTSDPTAYAMPTIMYAVVPKSASTPTTVKNELQAALTSILNVTTNQADADVLPNGFLPLTSSIASLAKDEVAYGIANPSYSAPQPGAVPSRTVASGRSFGTSFSASSLNPQTVGGTAASTVTTIPSSSPTYGPLFLTASESRLLLPATGAAGIALLAIGLLAMGNAFRSRRRGKASAGGEDLVESLSEQS